MTPTFEGALWVAQTEYAQLVVRDKASRQVFRF